MKFKTCLERISILAGLFCTNFEAETSINFKVEFLVLLPVITVSKITFKKYSIL